MTIKRIEARRFEPADQMLALRPSAFGATFELPFEYVAGEESFEETHVIRVRGPLMHRRCYFFESYEGIRDEVSDAIAAGVKRIVLDIDSPGGVVSGAFETSRELRELCTLSGVELLAFVDAQATSAGYALATAASRIGVTPTATVGSIGVIASLVSMVERNKAEGVAITVVKSGARKSDGVPDIETSEQAVAALQSDVDALAEMFFDLVSDHGFGGGVEALRAMEAGTFHGAEAVALGLATEITTLEKMKSGGVDAIGTKGNESMSTPMEDARAALVAVAEGENEEEATTARAALAAMDGEPDKEDEPDAEDSEDEPDAEDSEDEPDAEDSEDDDKEASASASSVAARAMAKVRAMEIREERRQARAKMSKFLATRPDLPKPLAKSLSKLSLSEAKEIAASVPVGTALSREQSVAAQVTATGTRGAVKVEGPALSAEDSAAMDRKLGIAQTETKIVNEPNRIVFGATVPKR